MTGNLSVRSVQVSEIPGVFRHTTAHSSDPALPVPGAARFADRSAVGDVCPPSVRPHSHHHQEAQAIRPVQPSLWRYRSVPDIPLRFRAADRRLCPPVPEPVSSSVQRVLHPRRYSTGLCRLRLPHCANRFVLHCRVRVSRLVCLLQFRRDARIPLQPNRLRLRQVRLLRGIRPDCGSRHSSALHSSIPSRLMDTGLPPP